MHRSNEKTIVSEFSAVSEVCYIIWARIGPCFGGSRDMCRRNRLKNRFLKCNLRRGVNKYPLLASSPGVELANLYSTNVWRFQWKFEGPSKDNSA